MALRHTAAVSNTAFLHAGELTDLRLAHREHRLNRWGIKEYYRYADNLVFFLGNDTRRAALLIKDLEERMLPYVAVLEEVSHRGIDFLDLTIWKDSRTALTGKLGFAPSLKDTSLRCTLSVFSSHPISIHASWLKSYVTNIYRHSSSMS